VVGGDVADVEVEVVGGEVAVVEVDAAVVDVLTGESVEVVVSTAVVGPEHEAVRARPSSAAVVLLALRAGSGIRPSPGGRRRRRIAR
jgi:hypothetical protein